MRETMVAYRIVRWGAPPELVEVPVPEPGPGEVLVEVAGNGLCHSDLAMAQMPPEIGEALGWHLPFTLGHEVGGRIVALGPGAGDTGAGGAGGGQSAGGAGGGAGAGGAGDGAGTSGAGAGDAGSGRAGDGADAAGGEPLVDGGALAEGDAVVLVSPASCGECPLCRRGRDSACPHGLAGRGYGRDGGLARYVVAPAARVVVRLGDLDPVVAAPLTDAGATAHHAVDRVIPRLPAGATAVVVGAGGLGGFAVQLLRALTPARVVAVDTNPARLAVARDLGAHDVADHVRAVGPVDVVLDFVGVDDTIAGALAAVQPYGAYGLVGAAGGTLRRPWYGGLPRDADVFTFQGSSLADVHAMVGLAEAGLVRSDVDRFPLSRVADAYAALESGELRGRAVVTPDG
jgi:propanol-preferring alcohol dehydrogenase